MVKPGRNEPCHCGSGKKYKKCCLEKDVTAEAAAINKTETLEKWEDEDEDLFSGGDIDIDEPEDEDFEIEDEEDEDWDEDESEEETGHLSIRNTPLPEITAEEAELVEEWWEAYDYEKPPREVQAHIEQFMHSHPHLVENLELDSEVLFDLRASYFKAGQYNEYIQFLLYMRKEFPSTYIKSAGYFDADIIAWLVAENRQNEIEEYLGYLKEYPVEFVEKLFEVVQLLEATDNIEPLVSLAFATCSKLVTSSEIMGGEEIFMPMVVQVMSKHLHDGFSDKDVASFVDELIETMAPYHFSQGEDPLDFWKMTWTNTFRPFTMWPDKVPDKKLLMAERYREVTQNFMRHLHESTGISWTSAWYYAMLMSEYFREYMASSKGKIKIQFDFSKGKIDTIIGILCKKLLWIDCTKSISLLAGIYHMATYLHECGNIDESAKRIIQEDCRSLYQQLYPRLKVEFMETVCFTKFPYLGVVEA